MLRIGSLFSGIGGASLPEHPLSTEHDRHVPSPWREISCSICGNSHKTRSLKAVTCSPKCRAALRKDRGNDPKGKPKREYPSSTVTEIRRQYESGMTVAEVQQNFPGTKVLLIMERYGIPRRAPAKRDQNSEHNHMWSGSTAKYQAVHLRLGKATVHDCVDCLKRADEWSYKGGCTQEQHSSRNCAFCHHPEHYAPRCRLCHRKFDARRRRQGVMPYV